MKRLLCLLFVLTAMLSLCACQGNFGSINLKDPVNIPENGVIDKSTIMQIKNENAIAVFVGTSGDFKYQWTVFASKIRDVKAVNLGVELRKTDDGSIRVVLNQAEAFGFSASLAIHLNERWSAQNATARAGVKLYKFELRNVSVFNLIENVYYVIYSVCGKVEYFLKLYNRRSCWRIKNSVCIGN